MTVLGSLEDEESSVDSFAHSSAHAPASASPSTSHTQSFVTAQQFEAMNDKWAEQFARFEALLSRGNLFTTPKTTVSSLPSHTLVSSQPFINPSAWHIGPVVPPADQDSVFKKGGESKSKQKGHEPSKSNKARPDVGPRNTVSSGPAFDIPGPGDDVQELVFQPVQTTSTADMAFQSTGSEAYTSQEQKSTGKAAMFTEAPKVPVRKVNLPVIVSQPLTHRLLHLVFHLPVRAMVCRKHSTGTYLSRSFMMSFPVRRILQ